jgi:parallel beta-helix repeat protein
VNQIQASTRNGIVIESSDVTIDLNGFVVDGLTVLVVPVAEPQPQGLQPDTVGILAEGTLENITILNGVVKDWIHRGIDLDSADGVRVEGVIVSGNGTEGLWVGEEALVTHCVARDNGASGIFALSGANVTECIARGNGDTGINLASRNTVRGCTAMENGVYGIALFSDSIVTQSSANLNGVDGIHLFGEDNHVLNNICNGNGGNAANGAGISSSNGDRLESNQVADNDVGISLSGTGSIVIKNSAGGNGENYSVIGTHAVGPFVGLDDPITTTNPWANFEF